VNTTVSTCGFIDGNGNERYDVGEPLFGTAEAGVDFAPATSSSTRHKVAITVAGRAGDILCGRARLDVPSPANVEYTDYLCARLPGTATDLPVGAVGTLGFGALLAAGLVVAQRRAARR
jgi:hypothetical protein